MLVEERIQRIAGQVASARKAQGLSQSEVYPRAALVSKIEHGGDVRLSSLLAVLERLGLELRIEPTAVRRMVTEDDFEVSAQPSRVLERYRVPDPE
ncbi:helix-turn-helix domain-containing protein [Endothiovibrio diazotrophicus]